MVPHNAYFGCMLVKGNLIYGYSFLSIINLDNIGGLRSRFRANKCTCNVLHLSRCDICLRTGHQEYKALKCVDELVTFRVLVDANLDCIYDVQININDFIQTNFISLMYMDYTSFN